MKKIIFFIALIITMTESSYSQFSNYNDLGILFSKDERNGTARFNSMAGAFGALGSDISATDINPAGAAVARQSKASITLENISTDFGVNYYGSSDNLKHERLNLSQAGVIFIFDGAKISNNEDWNRFGLTFNYKVKADFNNLYRGSGNSNFLFFDEHINDVNDSKNTFDRSVSQDFSKETSGINRVVSIGFSAVHDNKIFIGAALKLHDLEYKETAFLREINDDINGNELEVEDFNERFIDGNGFSFNIGFIYKLNKYIRIGGAYESPAWYQEIFEDQISNLTMFDVPDLNISGAEERSVEGPYSLQFTTPAKLTAGGALIFGKKRIG